MGQPPDQTCDSCLECMSGYTRKELEAEGWVWNVASKGRHVLSTFVMCPICIETYAKRREAKRAS